MMHYYSIDESPTARNNRGTSLASRNGVVGRNNVSGASGNGSANGASGGGGKSVNKNGVTSSSSWGLPPSNKRPRSNSQIQRDLKSQTSNQTSNHSHGLGLSQNDANLFGPLLTAASQEDTYGFGSMGMGNNVTNGGRGGGRSRSASLSALPALTSEDQLGASVLSSLYSSNQPR